LFPALVRGFLSPFKSWKIVLLEGDPDKKSINQETVSDKSEAESLLVANLYIQGGWEELLISTFSEK